MTQPRRPILVAANVLITPERELLMGRRSDNGLWEVPGGKVEAEPVVEAARRELREENGMEAIGPATQLGFADTWEEYGKPGGRWYVVQFLMWRGWRGFPELRGEHTEWGWWPLDVLPKDDEVTPGTRVLFHELLPRFSRALSQGDYQPGDEAAVFPLGEPYPGGNKPA